MPARTRIRLSSLLTLSMVGALACGMTSAAADPEIAVPSREEVADAAAAVDSAASDVSSIQAQLVLANQRAEQAWMAQAQAAENYNGLRVAADAAAQEAAQAASDLRSAEAAATKQRRNYSNVVVNEYQNSTSLKSLSSLLGARGISEAQEQAGAWDNVQGALDGTYSEYKATAKVAALTRTRATKASAESENLAAQAETAQQQAAAAASAAEAEAAAVSGERTRLITRLARLQNVSVQVAKQRQEALEQRAQQQAAQAAQTEAETAQTPTDTDQPTDQPTDEPTDEPTDQPTDEPTDEPTTSPSPRPTPAPTTPAPTTAPKPTTPATGNSGNSNVPAASTGARAAIAYARAQIGEPYVWAAAGPNSWDCSGLVMKAWAAGGKSLPHWSVGQYRATTPIKFNALKPGDLLFWGSSGSSSSIYHVAIYTGNGKMVHAPRPGRNVTEVSIYEWTLPNFYTRP